MRRDNVTVKFNNYINLLIGTLQVYMQCDVDVVYTIFTSKLILIQTKLMTS